jgi:predicted ATP-grasp superfamily ATP-dependent carboligase
MKALIVGDSSGALATVRELGRAGWIVGVGSSSRFGWAAMSRYTTHWHHVPAPVSDMGGFIGAINRATEKHGYEVIFGAGDAEVLALSANREKIGPLYPYAPHACVVRSFDKLHLVEVARKAGLATPITLEASESALKDLDLPVVVKSRLHWTPGKLNQETRVNAVVAHSRDEALRQAAHMRSAGAEPLFLQYVPGSVLSFHALVDDKHEIVSAQVQLTIYQYESESGVSARAKSVPVADSLAKRVQAFLAEIRWFGVVQFQFLCPDDGEPVLIDFNGRMFGSLEFANACGMRAMDTWARLATGRSTTPSEMVVGRHYQSLEGDLRWAMAQPGMMKRIYNVGDCLVEAFRAVHPLGSWSDPLPSLVHLARLPGRALKAWKPATSP